MIKLQRKKSIKEKGYLTGVSKRIIYKPVLKAFFLFLRVKLQNKYICALIIS